MYSVEFLCNSNAQSETLDFIKNLSNQKGKQNAILRRKINDYFSALEEYGLALPSQYIKHLEEEIWELRILNYRFLFAVLDNHFFVILHFVKKSRKTPRREINLAKARWREFLRERKNEI